MKRSQISWAIAEVMDRTAGPQGGPRSDLDRDLRRLVDVDRRLGLEMAGVRSKPSFAFLSRPPQGQGNETDYSEYDAFALTLGVQLLDGGFPQAKAIGFMRSVRPHLEQEHARILKISAEERIDETSPASVERNVRRGFVVRKPENMTWLVVQTRLTEAMAASEGGLLYRRNRAPEDPAIANICHGETELVTFLAHLTLQKSPALVMELINLAYQLSCWLTKAPIRKRGRGSGL